MWHKDNNNNNTQTKQINSLKVSLQNRLKRWRTCIRRMKPCNLDMTESVLGQKESAKLKRIPSLPRAQSA